MKVDIFEFFDSKDIANCNKNKMFTPSEMAVLITKCNCQSLARKLEALKEIASTYDLDEYRENQLIQVFENTGDYVNFYDELEETIRIWEEILDARYETQNVVFASKMFLKGYEEQDYGEWELCSTYVKALEHLEHSKKDLLESCDKEETELYGVIYRVPINKHLHFCDRYFFNHELELFDVEGAVTRYYDSRGKYIGELYEKYNVELDLPFKKGDRVIFQNPFEETAYGEFLGYNRDSSEPNDITEIKGMYQVIPVHGYKESEGKREKLWLNAVMLSYDSDYLVHDEKQQALEEILKKIERKKKNTESTPAVSDSLFEKISIAWDKIVMEVKDEFSMSEISYVTWLLPLRPFSLEANILKIMAPDSIFCGYVERKYTSHFKDAIKKIFGVQVEIIFQSREHLVLE